MPGDSDSDSSDEDDDEPPEYIYIYILFSLVSINESWVWCDNYIRFYFY